LAGGNPPIRSVATGALAALWLLAAPAGAGVTFREVETVQRPGAPDERQVRDVAAEGDSCRITQVESADPVAPAGTWLLVTPNDAFVVDPARRTLAPLVPTDLLPAESAAGDEAEVAITGVTLELLVDERGQPVLGLPTRYSVHRLRYVAQAPGAQPVQHEERHETWATALPWLEQVPGGWRAWRVAEDAGAAGARRELRAALDSLHGDGFILRHVVERREGPADAGNVTARVQREVTTLSEQLLPPETFERPAGYEIEEYLAPPPSSPEVGAPEPATPAPDGAGSGGG